MAIRLDPDSRPDRVGPRASTREGVRRATRPDRPDDREDVDDRTGKHGAWGTRRGGTRRDSRAADAVAAVAGRCGVTPSAVLGVLVLALAVVLTLGLRAVLVQRQSVPEPVVPASQLVAGAATPAAVARPRAGASPASSATGVATSGSTPLAGAAGAAGTGSGGTGAPSATAPSGTVVVDVVGQVRRPGVVELAAGSRVHQAVAAAGGALRGADLAAVNMARLVVDGEQVVVPRQGQVVPPAAGPPAPAPATGSGPAGPAGAGGPARPSQPVDLNTATAGELDALPGVGPVLAQRILDWRAQNGRFSSVDELSEVSGIGDAVLSGLRSRVRV